MSLKSWKLQPSPFDSGDEKDQVAVDFGAVDKRVDVAGVHRLISLQAGCADTITRWSEQWDGRTRQWHNNTQIKEIKTTFHTNSSIEVLLLLLKTSLRHRSKVLFPVPIFFNVDGSPFGQMSVQGMHILMRFSSTSILLLGHALTQELWSTTKLSGEKIKHWECQKQNNASCPSDRNTISGTLLQWHKRC